MEIILPLFLLGIAAASRQQVGLVGDLPESQ